MQFYPGYAVKPKEQILAHYLPNFRFLTNLDIDFPYASGNFTIPEKQYTPDVRRGLSGASSLILVNQIVMVATIKFILNDSSLLPGDVTMQDDEGLFYTDRMLVQRLDKIRYKKFISRNDDLKFKLKCDEVIKRNKNITYFKYSFDLCDGSHSGALTVCFSHSSLGSY